MTGSAEHVNDREATLRRAKIRASAPWGTGSATKGQERQRSKTIAHRANPGQPRTTYGQPSTPAGTGPRSRARHREGTYGPVPLSKPAGKLTVSFS